MGERVGSTIVIYWERALSSTRPLDVMWSPSR